MWSLGVGKVCPQEKEGGCSQGLERQPEAAAAILQPRHLCVAVVEPLVPLLLTNLARSGAER